MFCSLTLKMKCMNCFDLVNCNLEIIRVFTWNGTANNKIKGSIELSTRWSEPFLFPQQSTLD